MNQEKFIDIALIALSIIFIGTVVHFVFGGISLSFLSRSSATDESDAVEFLSPRENEIVSMDSGMYTIQWKTGNAPYKDKKVSLYAISNMNDPGFALVRFNIGMADFNAGSYSWVLPEDVGFASHFIDAKKLVKLAMELYAPDVLSQAHVAPEATQAAVIYSGAIHFKSIPIDVKFAFPQGGERLILGKSHMLTWELLPTNALVSDIILELHLGKPGEENKDHGHMHEEPFLANESRSYEWDGNIMYSPGLGHSLEPTKVKPGEYHAHLDFRTKDGSHHEATSQQFELINP
jgi:hypothetical protein